ncbi:hypothetical protein [Massilia scottii]|uniref:hypothetical protein n=1 Tax=Massilia scottii TaxID=3057166 RepID=UPI0027965B4C|nr:hypothetical protein [Massilia sp. CCM 9029]MDQ1834089.1 hypothetical protein [Massilia sp. CCM 9029]
MLQALYGTLVKRELQEFIREDSFAWHICRSLGRELNSTLEILAEDSDGFWGVLPVNDLNELLTTGWTLDYEWFKWTDDIFRDDAGLAIPETISRTYSAAEQMAAYGLYILLDEIGAMGPAAAQGENEQGWSREGVKEHEATCLIRAYQAVVFALKLSTVSDRSPDERVRDAMSAIGRRRAEIRHAPARLAQEFVKLEWTKHKSEYSENKSQFVRTYLGIVKNKFKDAKGDPLKITEKQMREVWLSETPSARKPAS